MDHPHYRDAGAAFFCVGAGRSGAEDIFSGRGREKMLGAGRGNS